MAGGIDNVYSMALPIGCCRSRSDCNTSLLLLLHVVHGCISIVSITNLMNFTAIVQNSLSSGGLSGVDVSHYADISCFFKRNFSWQKYLSFRRLILW